MKLLRINLLLILSTLLMFSCTNDDKDNFVSPVTHVLHVTFDEDFGSKNAENVEIVLTNNKTAKQYKVTTDMEGKASVSLLPGEYQINASANYDMEYMQKMFDFDQPASFNASSKVEIDKNSAETHLTLTLGKTGNLVIKQIYYAGSDIRKAAVFRDQFIEIFNNSNETVYLDGLCFAQIKNSLSVPKDLDDYYRPDGSYDWSKSVQLIGMGDKANTDYVYAEEVIQIPGTGKENPLKPGESVIIAGTALNHKEPLTVIGSDGKPKTYEVSNPELTIDLSKAPFEVYMGDYLDKPLLTDIDTPAKNVNILYKTSGNRDLILDPFGRDAFVIFFANTDNINEWKKVAPPNLSGDNAQDASNLALQIPKDVVIDGVELQNYQDARPKPKWLTDDIDAGFVKGIKGKYSSESAIRKVSKKVNGRVFYKDSNNSTNDFEFLDLPDVSSLK